MMNAEIRRTIETSLDLYRRTAPIEYDALVAERCGAARAWLAAQPDAEWRPVEDGEYEVGPNRLLHVHEHGKRLGVVYKDDAIAVSLPPTLRLCERTTQEAT